MDKNTGTKKLLKRKSLSALLVEDLRKRILNGEFPGGALLRQEYLANQYGVSRMPVREALRLLDSEGLVTIQNNYSAIVSELSLDEIDEIFDLRLGLELDLLRRAMPNLTAASRKKSQDILDELDQAYANADSSRWGFLNGEFHKSLYEPSNRTITLSMFSRISILVDRYLRLQITMTDAMTNGALEHKALLNLAYSGKTAEALELLTTHISRTKEQLIKILTDLHR